MDDPRHCVLSIPHQRSSAQDWALSAQNRRVSEWLDNTFGRGNGKWYRQFEDVERVNLFRYQIFNQDELMSGVHHPLPDWVWQAGSTPVRALRVHELVNNDGEDYNRLDKYVVGYPSTHYREKLG